MFSIAQPQETAPQDPITLSFKNDFEITFEILAEFFNRIIAAFKSFRFKSLGSKKIAAVITPSEVKTTSPIHGMYALKSVRQIIKTLHEENLLNFVHKPASTVEYTLSVEKNNHNKINITAKQKDSNGEILEEKMMWYFNNKDNKIPYNILRAQEDCQLQEIGGLADLEILAKFADNYRKDLKTDLNAKKFFDSEKDYEDQMSIQNYTHKREYTGMDFINDAFAENEDEEGDEDIETSNNAESFFDRGFNSREEEVLEILSDPNFKLKDYIQKPFPTPATPKPMAKVKVDEAARAKAFAAAMAFARAAVEKADLLKH